MINDPLLSYENWVPKPKGKHKIEYEENDAKRANKKCRRKKTLITEAHDLGVISGGELFVKYRGPPHKHTGKRDIWVFASNDAIYQEYKTSGIKPSTDVREGRLDQDGDLIDTIKIFKAKPQTAPTCTVSKPTSDNVEINLLPEEFFVTPTKTVAADLNFAMSNDTLGISTIDLPSVSQMVNVETSGTVVEIITQDNQSDSNIILPVENGPVFSTPITEPATEAGVAPVQPFSTPISVPVTEVAPVQPLFSSQSQNLVQINPQENLQNDTAQPKADPKSVVKSFVAKRIKFKQEQGVPAPKTANAVANAVTCVVCCGKKKKRDSKWQWKCCTKCIKEAHTVCLGLTKQDKQKTFICETCENTDN